MISESIFDHLLDAIFSIILYYSCSECVGESLVLYIVIKNCIVH